MGTKGQDTLDVAVAIVWNDKQEVLITQRPAHKPYPLLWEFPGGKLERGETAEEAVKRELKEELGIECRVLQPWLMHPHLYATQLVKLHVYWILAFEGRPQCLEGQLGYLWVAPPTLLGYSFPEGNYPLIDKLLAETLPGL